MTSSQTLHRIAVEVFNSITDKVFTVQAEGETQDSGRLTLSSPSPTVVSNGLRLSSTQRRSRPRNLVPKDSRKSSKTKCCGLLRSGIKGEGCLLD